MYVFRCVGVLDEFDHRRTVLQHISDNSFVLESLAHILKNSMMSTIYGVRIRVLSTKDQYINTGAVFAVEPPTTRNNSV